MLTPFGHQINTHFYNKFWAILLHTWPGHHIYLFKPQHYILNISYGPHDSLPNVKFRTSTTVVIFLFSFLFCCRQLTRTMDQYNTNYQHHKQNTTLQNLVFRIRTWVLCLLIVKRLDLTKAKIPSSFSFNCVFCFMSISEVKRKVIISLVNPRFLVIYLKTYI